MNSSGRRNTGKPFGFKFGVEQLCWGCPVQSFPWPMVELGGDVGEVIGGVNGEVAVLAEVLSSSPFMFSLHPRCHGLPGWAKNTPSSNSDAMVSWLAISDP